MFGYIQPDAPYLFKKDETLYKAMYCGLCKSIGAGCGQRARSALTYDMAFMSALVHNIRHEDVTIKKSRCAIHWIKRRPIALTDDTTVLLGCINTVLAYYKLCDDKADGERKGILRHLYKKGVKRAIKRHGAVAAIIKEQTQKQAELEKSGCNIIDMACEPSAEMMKRLSEYALGEYSTPTRRDFSTIWANGCILRTHLTITTKTLRSQGTTWLYNAYGQTCKKGRGRKKLCRTYIHFRQSFRGYARKTFKYKIQVQSRFDRQYNFKGHTVKDEKPVEMR